jgi:hypothetical protein
MRSKLPADAPDSNRFVLLLKGLHTKIGTFSWRYADLRIIDTSCHMNATCVSDVLMASKSSYAMLVSKARTVPHSSCQHHVIGTYVGNGYITSCLDNRQAGSCIRAARTQKALDPFM